jgi:hypothetical protein
VIEAKVLTPMTKDLVSNYILKDLVRQGGCSKGNKLGQLFNGESCLEAAYGVLNLTTNFKGDEGQR